MGGGGTREETASWGGVGGCYWESGSTKTEWMPSVRVDGEWRRNAMDRHYSNEQDPWRMRRKGATEKGIEKKKPREEEKKKRKRKPTRTCTWRRLERDEPPANRESGERRKSPKKSNEREKRGNSKRATDQGTSPGSTSLDHFGRTLDRVNTVDCPISQASSRHCRASSHWTG